MMIEETFAGKEKRVPGCILKACLHEKDVRSRQERADIFLRYVLTDEELLLSFRNVFLRNADLTLNTVLCETHKGLSLKRTNFNSKHTLKFIIKGMKADKTIICQMSQNEVSIYMS